jgi:L-rhamnose mutarotase
MRPYNLKVSAFNAMLPTIFTLSITSRENLLEITQGSKDSGIEGLEIYLWGTCMLTIMEVDQNFSLEKRAKADEQDPKVQAWKQLMWSFQQALSGAKPGGQ